MSKSTLLSLAFWLLGWQERLATILEHLFDLSEAVVFLLFGVAARLAAIRHFDTKLEGGPVVNDT